MSTSEISAFNSTLETTNLWLSEIMNRMGWKDRHAAYHALRAVLHVLRDRLTIDEAAALGAQLPMLVRGIYYEGWHAAGKPNKERTKEEFLSHVREFFTKTPEIDVEEIVCAVLHVLAQHVSPGEVRSLEHVLPPELRTLFPEVAMVG